MESERKRASNLTPDLRKWSKIRLKSDPKFWNVAKMRLKSDPKIPTLPRAKSPNSSSLLVNENSVVLRNVNGVFYAKMGSKWVEGVGLTMANPLQKVSLL